MSILLPLLKIKNGGKKKCKVHKVKFVEEGSNSKEQDRQRGGGEREKNGKDGCISASMAINSGRVPATRRNWFPYRNVLAGNVGQW